MKFIFRTLLVPTVHVAKGVGRNFPGEGSPAIFQYPGGLNPDFGRFNGQNERIFGPEGQTPCLCLPMPLHVACL